MWDKILHFVHFIYCDQPQVCCISRSRPGARSCATNPATRELVKEVRPAGWCTPPRIPAITCSAERASAWWVLRNALNLQCSESNWLVTAHRLRSPVAPAILQKPPRGGTLWRQWATQSRASITSCYAKSSRRSFEKKKLATLPPQLVNPALKSSTSRGTSSRPVDDLLRN